jgi:hypothetical protein
MPLRWMTSKSSNDERLELVILRRVHVASSMLLSAA